MGPRGGSAVFEGTRFDAGDKAIAVEWFDRHPVDPEGLHFTPWNYLEAGHDEDQRFIINSTEMRAARFAMNDVTPRPINVLGRAARST